MAKTLRTSGDYTVKAGAGYDSGSGSHTIKLDSKDVRITGDLTVDGDQVIVNTETLSIEDPMIVLSRNTSSTVLDEWDSGILVNRGESANNASFYWDGDDDVWKAMLTTSTGAGTEITETSRANIRVAAPFDDFDAATKKYVDDEIATVSSSAANTGDITFVGSTISGPSNADVTITSGGTGGIILDDAIRIRQNHIEGTRSNDDILIQPSGTGAVVIEDVLTFSGAASTPTATTVTKLYNKTPAGGGTGLYFINSQVSATEGELISKKKATALAIALG